MSQNPDADVVVKMLPPSFAIYLPGALIVPVLVKPASDTAPPTVYVAPVVLASNTHRIHWSLVLLASNSDERVELAPEPIQFKPVGGILPFGDQISLSATQVALVNFSIARAITEYCISFQFGKGGLLGPVIKAMVTADPAISVTPDPVEIPTWP